MNNLSILIERRKKLEKAKYCFGVTSRCSDGKHVIFVDFDHVNIEKVYHSLSRLQKAFELSTFHILKSNNGFNAFCLSKMDFDDIVDMLKDCKYVDPLYIKLSEEKRRLFVLRMGSDKVYFDSIFSNDSVKMCSYAHFLFFTSVMGFPVDPYHLDRSHTIRIIAYKSVKDGFVDLNE